MTWICIGLILYTIFLSHRINSLESCLLEILEWTRYKDSKWAKKAKKLINYRK